MKRIIAAAVLALAAPAEAETLSIDAIITLAESGIGDDAIVAKIRDSGADFDLTTDQMIGLKKKGVSGSVIAAMLSGGAKVPILSQDSPDPMIAHPTGLYLLSSDSTNPRMQRINATVTNQAKTGGLFGYALTGGIASMSIKAAIQNDTSRTPTESRTPVFYMFFDESNPATSIQTSAWQAGTSVTVTAPSEFTLIRLMKKDGRREARVGSINIGGSKTGVMDQDRLAFDYQQVRPGVFKVTPMQALAPGEYGFIFAIAGGGAGGAMTARIFDFTVK